MNDLVSVIMPVYNAAKFLRETVDSVLNQTYQNWELIMLDDMSTDHSLEIAREYAAKDPRVRVIEAQENAGVARVRNRGIAQAKGDYIALLDSDDVWLPDKLERQLRLMDENRAQIAYCSYDFINEDSHPIKKPFLVPPRTDYRHMLASSVISCSTALIEASVLKAHPFKPEFYHEDYVLWMELLSLPEITAAGDPKVLAHYRQVTGSRSNNKGNAARERWKIYREALGLGLGQSALAFAAYAFHGVRKYYL